MTPCRFILDPPASGAWNMAVDEALWESAAERGVFTFRFYSWETATLSLGYFQDDAERKKHPASAACPVVRRPSGGGAIVHDREITYSLAVPKSHPLAKKHLLLYETVHGTLIETLVAVKVPARLCKARRESPTRPLPFLCFQRHASGDVLVGETKIAGSAQRRSHGAVLQHGSILWARSPAAPELPGLSDVAGGRTSPEKLLECWQRQMTDHLSLSWNEDRLSAAEQRRAEELHKFKYATDPWNHARGRPIT